MEITAKSKYIRMSPRKVRLVVDLVRGLNVETALDQLKFLNKRAVPPVRKTIESAIGNAANDYEIKADNLKIKEIRVDEGPTLYRWLPKAHGRATPLRKRTCHINVILTEIADSGERSAKKKSVEAPVRLESKPKTDEGVKVEARDRGKKKSVTPSGEEEDDKNPDARRDVQGVHARNEGGRRGFVGKMFNRKSG